MPGKYSDMVLGGPVSEKKPRKYADRVLGGAGAAPETEAPQDEPSKYGAGSSNLLPISYSESGEASFDPNVGVVGALKRGFTAPGEVWSGELDPMSPEGMRRASEMALIYGPTGAASRAGVGWAGVPKPVSRGNYKTVTPAAPTREALKDATTAGYDKVAALDVKYTAPAVEAMATKLESALNEKGLIAGLKGVKDVHTLIGTLKGAPKDAYVKMSSLDAFRQRMGELASSPKKQVASAANEAIGVVDDFIAAANPASLVDRAVTAGGKGVIPRGQSFAGADAAANKALAEKASKLILEARGNAAAGFRAGKIAELEEVMGLRTAASNSGMNLDNTTRSKLLSFLKSSGGKGVRGFNAEEKAAITKIIEGTRAKNLGRRVGNLLGGGGGIGQTIMTAGPAITAGLASGSPLVAGAAAIPGVVGAVSKGATNRAARKEIRMLDELLRSRSPLAEQTMIPQQVYAPRAIPGIAGRGAAAGLMQNPQARQMTARERMMQSLVGQAPGPGGYY